MLFSLFVMVPLPASYLKRSINGGIFHPRLRKPFFAQHTAIACPAMHTFLRDETPVAAVQGMVRTVDPVAAIVEILYAPDFYDDVVALMEGLAAGEVPSLERTAA